MDALPDEQRIKRICELLSKAVVLDAASRITSQRVVTAESEPEDALVSGGSDVARIESYLALVGEASPAMIRDTLGLPRMRIYRAAQRLIAAGKIIISGQTRTVMYRLSPAYAAKFGLN